MPNYIHYPESLFTNFRIQLHEMRCEILEVERATEDLVPQDMANIFSDLCVLDNRAIKAQQVRGYSAAATPEELRRLVEERRRATNPGPREVHSPPKHL